MALTSLSSLPQILFFFALFSPVSPFHSHPSFAATTATTIADASYHHCVYPHLVHLMANECDDLRCEHGYTPSHDGKNCTDDDECLSSPCMNGGVCKNLDRGEGFYCICPEGYSGDLCNALKQEKVMRLSTAALAAILICLINILGKKNPSLLTSLVPLLLVPGFAASNLAFFLALFYACSSLVTLVSSLASHLYPSSSSHRFSSLISATEQLYRRFTLTH